MTEEARRSAESELDVRPGRGIRRYVARSGVVFVFALLSINLLIAVFFFTPILSGSIERWVRSDSLPRQPVDAIVVLGGYHSADRLLEGLMLLDAGHSSLLLTPPQGVSGDDPDGRDARNIIAMAGATSSWRSIGPAWSTHDEATNLRQARERHNLRSIIVVTSPMHTRRACAVVEKVARLRVTCVAARERYPVTRNARDFTNRIQATYQYFYERLAIIKYRRNGWY